MGAAVFLLIAAALAGSAPDIATIEKAIAQGQVPIVEPLADGSSRVTFVWRGAETQSIELDWPVWTPDRRTNQFERVPGTDLWIKSVVLPARTRLSYRLVPDIGATPRSDRKAFRAMFAARAQPDPLNPRRWDAGSGANIMSLLELPGAPPQPWVQPRPDVQRGTVEKHRFTSALLGNSRDIAIYRPAGGLHPRKLLIVFDGDRYRREAPLPVILDNMIAAGALPPVAALFISNPSDEARATELACNPVFSRFLAEELLPWAKTRMAVPDNPGDRILAGASFGGLASACAALDYPDEFGAVLSQSGSFWWRPREGQSPRAIDSDEPNWVARKIAGLNKPLPVRFHIEAGQLETQADGEGIRDTSRALHSVLQERGYTVNYAEPAGGHDWYSWRGSISDGLQRLSETLPADDPK